MKQESGEPASKRLYEATVQEFVMKEAGPDGPAQWLARITYGDESFEVDSDCLVALEKPVEEKTDEYIRMEPFDWGKTAELQAKNIAVQGMDQAMVMVHDAIQHLAIQCSQSTIDAKPNRCVFRVVALKDFGPGLLMLTPFCGKEPSLAKRSSAESDSEKNDYITRMHLTVSTKERKGRKKSPELTESTDTSFMHTPFVVQSPLPKLQTTKEKFDELSPVWVLPKTKVMKDVNMESQMIVFDFSPMIPLACKVPSPIKKALFSIKMQVVINKRKIKKGERLCLSVMEPDLLTSDEESSAEADAE